MGKIEFPVLALFQAEGGEDILTLEPVKLLAGNSSPEVLAAFAWFTYLFTGGRLVIVSNALSSGFGHSNLQIHSNHRVLEHCFGNDRQSGLDRFLFYHKRNAH